MPKVGLQFWHLVVIVLLAAMLGTALGDMLAGLFGDGPVGRVLEAGLQVGTTEPWSVDIKVLQLTLGLSLRFTVLGTISAATALVIFFRRL